MSKKKKISYIIMIVIIVLIIFETKVFAFYNDMFDLSAANASELLESGTLNNAISAIGTYIPIGRYKPVTMRQKQRITQAWCLCQPSGAVTNFKLGFRFLSAIIDMPTNSPSQATKATGYSYERGGGYSTFNEYDRDFATITYLTYLSS